jgi:hypothetical protein
VVEKTTSLLLKQRRDFDNWRTVEQINEDENPQLGGGSWLKSRVILARKTEALLDCFRQSMDTCGRLELVAIILPIYVTKSLASDGFAFHFIRVARNVIVLSTTTMRRAAAAKSVGVKAKERFSAVCFSSEGISACSRSSSGRSSRGAVASCGSR